MKRFDTIAIIIRQYWIKNRLKPASSVFHF